MVIRARMDKCNKILIMITIIVMTERMVSLI